MESLPAQEPTQYKPEVYMTGYAKKQFEQEEYIDQVDKMIAAAGTAGPIALEAEIDLAV
jgi:hypothetical protein